MSKIKHIFAEKIKRMIQKGKQTKEKLMSGLNQVSDMVKLTLGARGKTVAIKNPYGIGVHVTKDGATVANSIVLEDKIEEIGAEFVKSASKNTADIAGDGTSTTSVLVQSMCKDMYNHIELGYDHNKLIEDMKYDLDLVKNYVKSKSMSIESTDDIYNIAKVSANNDESIASLIKSIYDSSTFDVEIDVRDADSTEDSFEIVNGYTMRDTGYASPQYVNTDKGRVEYSNPKVYLVNGNISRLTQEMMDVLLNNSNRANDLYSPIIIIANDIEESVVREINMALSNSMIYDVVFVQTSLIYQDRINAFEDTSAVLGCKYSDSTFLAPGSCEKVIVEKNSITFINGAGDTTDHLANLKSLTDGYESTKRRIFALESTAAIIKVGGNSTTERGERKDRIDDAVYAVKSALEEGYCYGGSTVYLLARHELELKTLVFSNALRECYSTMMKNANLEPYEYVHEIYSKGYGYGYNVRELKIDDFSKSGIYDSSKVLRFALENATHTAINFSTIEGVIY